jgi:hypothetical protein
MARASLESNMDKDMGNLDALKNLKISASPIKKKLLYFEGRFASNLIYLQKHTDDTCEGCIMRIRCSIQCPLCESNFDHDYYGEGHIDEAPAFDLYERLKLHCSVWHNIPREDIADDLSGNWEFKDFCAYTYASASMYRKLMLGCTVSE